MIPLNYWGNTLTIRDIPQPLAKPDSFSLNGVIFFTFI